eukprot:TRINITY_DN28025_c0_g1_i1.p1 TRINITY_DN28025_c0_g1~~TRINITY_DN28025_c0_g1_i1.p1  ORF type:complete len:387 (+),score=38.81 TRINITY_DN28025_c0_g1_i1:43-1161(+)
MSFLSDSVGAVFAKQRRKRSVDDCVTLRPQHIDRLQDTLLSQFPWTILVNISATLGPWALFALRATSRAHRVTFHRWRFAPTRRADEWHTDPNAIAAGEMDIGSGRDEQACQFQPGALDNMFLALTRMKGESHAAHKERVSSFLQDTSLRNFTAGTLVALCQLPAVISRTAIFPNPWSPPELSANIAFPPLHVAIFAKDLSTFRLLVHLALYSQCDLDTAFYFRRQAVDAEDGQMSPLLLAFLTIHDDDLAQWVGLMIGTGARFNNTDRLIILHILNAFRRQCDGDIEQMPEEWRACICEFNDMLSVLLALIYRSDQTPDYNRSHTLEDSEMEVALRAFYRSLTQLVEGDGEEEDSEEENNDGENDAGRIDA